MHEIKKDDAKRIIIAQLQSTPIDRKTLVEKCIKAIDLPSKILNDKSPGKDLNKIKCNLGNAITDLLERGILVLVDNKLQYQKTTETAETVKRDIQIDNRIKELLSNSSLTRKQLFETLVSDFEKIPSQTVKTVAGQILSSSIRAKKIENNNGTLSLSMYKQNEPETFEQKNKQIFSQLSDEALVDKSLLMLEAWFKSKGYSEITSKNIDGPQDGGIDGIIKMKDEFNYNEKVIIQVKNLHKTTKHVPLNEIREFCGVLASEQDATKGFFITNTKYHIETEKFAKKYKTKYFALIDGEKWLELANKCKYDLSKD